MLRETARIKTRGSFLDAVPRGSERLHEGQESVVSKHF
jgi:hypothetical protein